MRSSREKVFAVSASGGGAWDAGGVASCMALSSAMMADMALGVGEVSVRAGLGLVMKMDASDEIHDAAQ